ncbi:putative molybdenum carrier protein [Nocardioides sp. YIM 152588]|uniref:YpsA SLOG family protein n=1 Tax=Nocardioides sp. YIM 152588 TaxID=3158259 RepID=UPI0032E52A2E
MDGEQRIPRIARVVSGGQTGADRAALDAAIAAGLPYGGWCPAGGWAEDLTEPPGVLARYPALRAADSADPSARTLLNVRDSHATLIVRGADAASPGTDLTLRAAGRLRRPCLVTPGGTGTLAQIDAWLAAVGDGLTLNVAGPRESQQPGVYRTTRELLAVLLDSGPASAPSD